MPFVRKCHWCATIWRRTNIKCISSIMIVLITSCILYSIHHKAMLEINEVDATICKTGDLADERRFIHRERGINTITLNCIQRAPDFAVQKHRVFPIATHLSEPYLRLPKHMVYTQRVILLSPVRDAAARLRVFANLISTLSYPHNLISVHFGEDGSHDDTIEVAKNVSHQLVHKFGFANATVYKLNIKGNNRTRKNRHDPKHQVERRSHMGKARNLIMEYGLQNEEWILWIDSDVVSFRDDLIQQFLYSNKDVMVASALASHERNRSNSIFRYYINYDLNTFREVVQGDTQHRIWLFNLRAEGREVPVDYVGGCTLMIRAECYRKGLRFTEGPYKPTTYKLGRVQWNIETEGLAKMARDLGMGVYGLPHLEVLHKE